jgi:hypothetical protein
MRSPRIFTRKSRLQPKEFLISSAKRLLQQNLPIAGKTRGTAKNAARRPAVTAVLWSRYAVRRRGSKDQPSATQRRNDASIVFLRGVTNGRLGGTAPPSRWSPLLAGAFGYGD